MSKYFTKRPTGYPGQGVWPSDGRSLTAMATIRFKIKGWWKKILLPTMHF
ncbi:MAG: hypothetical protein IPO65_11960 [Saprospiraceae bacterium]|nr:hypothetical protein [Saprospiraceae bacterium]